MNMRPRLHAVVVSLLLYAFATACGAADRTAASNENASVTDVVDVFVTAWNKHDIATLTGLFTANGRFKSPAGHGARTRPGIHKLLVQEHGDLFKESTLAATIKNIAHPKTGSAVATGTFTLSNIPAVLGINVAREGTFDFHLVRQKSRWLIASARISEQ